MRPDRTADNTSEMAILGRVFETDKSPLSPAAARSILALGFAQVDQDRMQELAEKAREGDLTPAQQVEIDNYERAGHVLSLLKLKARGVLRRTPGQST